MIIMDCYWPSITKQFEDQNMIPGYEFKNPAVVKQIEEEYPAMMAEYKKIMMEQYETFCLKQSNYGPGNISVGTSLATPEDIKLSLTGLWFRMNDKIQRLKQLVVLGKQR